MGPRGIPRNVQRFIEAHVSSVAQLEVLLLMRANTQAAQTAESVAAELRIDTAWAKAELDRLRGEGLLQPADAPGAYCYAPRSETLATAVDGLADSFATHRVSVITMIFARPPSAVDSFADAFRLRKGDDG